MPNNTIKNYKEEIRVKFEKEKNGPFSNYFNPASQANLRDLCWKIFKSNPNSDDLNVYYDFFKLKFNPDTEDMSITYTDKFKKVGDFLKRKTEPAKIDTINLAAILVGFELRPYQNFFKNADTQEPVYDNEREETKNDSKEKEINEKEKFVKDIPQDDTPVTKNNFYLRLFEKLKKTLTVIILIFSLIATVIYFAFFKNHCMQWSEDHYEVVDCSSNKEPALNEIIPLNEDLLDFRKLKACDTTTCFKKNGEAFIWYGKTGNEVDFFNDNGNGRHPETKVSLHPVTHYMFNKYLKGKPCQ